MQTLNILRVGFAAAALALSGAALSAVATFDDLPTPPAVDSVVRLVDANNGQNSYAGAIWDDGFSVVGDAYHVGSGATDPKFGIPHSPHYFVTNQGGGSVGITTTQVLTGAWFGRNTYYGFDNGGADQVTLVALAGSSPLLSLAFDLPENNPGLAEPLSFVDTSAFAALSGITGYRIDRRQLGDQTGHWVADDFQFTAPTPVPIPAGVWLFGPALAGFARFGKRRQPS
ncbi:MAG: hypothetical protein ACKN9T_08365 [Candidatus Methylumidiphilus sp.]